MALETRTAVLPAARTTSGDSGSLRAHGPDHVIRAQLNVTAASGVAPTLTVVIEDTLDGGATWNIIGTFAQKTAAGREVLNIDTPFGTTTRVRWTIGGTTPSFTFAVDWARSVYVA